MILKVGWLIAIFSIITAGLSVAYATQQQIKKNDLKEIKTTARIAFADQNWAESKKGNLELLQHNKNDKMAWFNLGLSQHYLGEYDEARSSFSRALNLGFEPGIIHYNFACTYAQEDNLPKLIENIEISKNYGFPVAKFSESDPDLAEYRTNEEFRKVIDSARKD